jgi:hypothetical protein
LLLMVLIASVLTVLLKTVRRTPDWVVLPLTVQTT